MLNICVWGPWVSPPASQGFACQGSGPAWKEHSWWPWGRLLWRKLEAAARAEPPYPPPSLGPVLGWGSPIKSCLSYSYSYSWITAMPVPGCVPCWSSPCNFDWLLGLTLNLPHCYGPSWWSVGCVWPWLLSPGLILTLTSWLDILTWSCMDLAALAFCGGLDSGLNQAATTSPALPTSPRLCGTEPFLAGETTVSTSHVIVHGSWLLFP